MKRTRALAIAILPATLVGTLLVTGCTTGSDVNCVPDGEVSKAITLDGDFGGEVTLTSETPIEASKFERSVLKRGDGEKIKADELVVTSFTAINGDNGQVISAESTEMQNSAETMAPWVADSMNCSAIGDRVVAVSPVSDVVGEGNEPSVGMEAGGTIVLVFDFLEKAPTPPGTLESGDLLEGPEGTSQSAPEGFPTVETDADGSPIITMPQGVEQPSELTVATLIKGSGEEVQPGDRVYVNYRGVIWRTGEEFDSSWSRGEPTSFMTTEVIEGFKVALEGNTVGSQIIALVPANDGGYGSEWLVSQGYEGDDVMVFVLDILGTVHAG